jgi:hypothetical protein
VAQHEIADFSHCGRVDWLQGRPESRGGLDRAPHSIRPVPTLVTSAVFVPRGPASSGLLLLLFLRPLGREPRAAAEETNLDLVKGG